MRPITILYISFNVDASIEHLVSFLTICWKWKFKKTLNVDITFYKYFFTNKSTLKFKKCAWAQSVRNQKKINKMWFTTIINICIRRKVNDNMTGCLIVFFLPGYQQRGLDVLIRLQYSIQKIDTTNLSLSKSIHFVNYNHVCLMIGLNWSKMWPFAVFSISSE